MAFASAVAPPSPFLLPTKHIITNQRKFPVSTFTGGRSCLSLVPKAVGDSSDTSSGASIVKYVKGAWSTTEDRIALAGLGFAVIAAIWASSNLITAIDKLPLLPGALEFIGILFSWWFVYRYLLFKPDSGLYFVNKVISAWVVEIISLTLSCVIALIVIGYLTWENIEAAMEELLKIITNAISTVLGE